MEATVQMIYRNLGIAKAVTQNSIAVVFRIHVDCEIKLGDNLDIDLLRIGEEQIVQNLTNQTDFKVIIKDNNVHDLLLPANHGTTRFPTFERRKGA